MKKDKKKSIFDEKMLIIKLTSYQGNDTALEVAPNPLFMIVNAKTGQEIDNGYRSYKEAKNVCPNAIN